MDRINEMLAQLQELTDEQVAELESSILSEFENLEQQDLSPRSVDALESLAGAVENVRNEQSRRVAEREALTAKAQEAAARIRPAEAETPEGNADETAVGDPNHLKDPPIAQGESQDKVPADATAPLNESLPDGPGLDETRKAVSAPPIAHDPNSAEAKKKYPVAASNETPVEAEAAAKTDEDKDDKEKENADEASTETPVEAEASADGENTTEDSQSATEASGESEDTSAEAPAEAESSNQTQEAPVTTTASGTGASLEIEPPADRRPLTKPTATVAITAGADIPGVSAGSTFNDMNSVAEAFVKRLHSIRHVNGGDGEQHIVASLQYEYPESRLLAPNDAAENTTKIQGVTSPEALTAAAGICLPLETRYDMGCDIGVTDRPIRDSLARFGADRGGIRFFNSPVIEDMAGATGFWRGDTDGQNWATYGPNGAVTSPANQKPCLEVQCTSEETAYIEAVTLCLTFNNLTTRTFPELIKRHNELALVAHARIAENHLLAQLEAGSTAITVGTPTLGAAPELFNLLARVVAAYRHKHRMNNVSPLRMLAPSWLLDLLKADLALRMPGDGLDSTFGASEATINAWLRARNVNITWHLDGVGPAMNVGATDFEFPETVEFGIWAEGTWLYLDGGTLDLGVIRDSSLVATNQYKQFVETFEGLANMGCDSYWVTAPLEACGSAAALVETCGA